MPGLAVSQLPKSEQKYVFAGRAGRPLSAAQRHFLYEGLKLYGIDTTAAPPCDLADLFGSGLTRETDRASASIKRPAPIRLEIGFGAGEHLIAEARRRPDIGFIGCEAYRPGIAKLLAAVARHEIKNIRVYSGDAHALLFWLAAAGQPYTGHSDMPPTPMKRISAASCIERIDLLFPDPWPKKRHHKRRFVTAENLDLIAGLLTPPGQFRFASDSADYVASLMARLETHGAFRWTAESPEDWRTPFAHWPGTRYEAKARAAGRPVYFLEFARL